MVHSPLSELPPAAIDSIPADDGTLEHKYIELSIISKSKTVDCVIPIIVTRFLPN